MNAKANYILNFPALFSRFKPDQSRIFDCYEAKSMIEPFEYEPKKLQAKPPAGHIGTRELGGDASIDRDIRMPSLHDPMEEVKLDRQQARIFQTRIGNPKLENASEADLVPDRVVGQGPLVVSEEAPRAVGEMHQSMSEILSAILDAERFVPAVNRHAFPSMSVNSLSSPFLEPSLTTAYVHKYTPNWA
jgi:hypothetical protein